MEIDESGLKKAFNLIGENLKAIDSELRSQYVGQDPNKVKPVLAALLDAAGADLPDAELAAWSTAIAQDRPFEIRLT